MERNTIFEIISGCSYLSVVCGFAPGVTVRFVVGDCHHGMHDFKRFQKPSISEQRSASKLQISS